MNPSMNDYSLAKTSSIALLRQSTHLVEKEIWWSIVELKTSNAEFDASLCCNLHLTILYSTLLNHHVCNQKSINMVFPIQCNHPQRTLLYTSRAPILLFLGDGLPKVQLATPIVHWKHPRHPDYSLYNLCDQL